MFSFDGLPPDCCPACKQRKDAQFQKVRGMVKETPGITALEVHERTDVPLSTIIKYIEAGYLEVASSKENLDTGDMQIWIDKATKRGKKAKAKAEEAATNKVKEIDDDLPETPKKNRKTEIHFIVK
jgi:hypothetical protein